MEKQEKTYWVYNATGDHSLLKGTVPQDVGLNIIRFMEVQLAQDEIRARQGKGRQWPTGIVFKLLDAESEEGKQFAERRRKHRERLGLED